MVNAKHIGRVGSLAVALGVGDLRHTATRMTVAISAVGVVMAAMAGPAAASTMPPEVTLSADTTGLIVGGTTVRTWNQADLDRIMNLFITPTHPGQTITPVAVTTPEEYWPITGLFRLVGLAVGDPDIWGPGGAGWPAEPWWKLSGLFDLTIDQSIRAGTADLEQAMAEHGDDHLVIYGLSQGATVVNTVKRRLAKQYPAGATAPDIDFVLQGDPNHPNGGLSSRFPGLYIPILDLTFDGPAPTDTQFDTVELNRQYDGAADFPLYPLNVVATLNALLGFVYLHTRPFEVRLPEDPMTSPAYQGTHGDTSYYFFETEDLPLFAPLRGLGVPERLIDVIEPFFRVLVELGYDRSIPPWQPTPARLIPRFDAGQVAVDLVDAIGEGLDNAAALFGAPPLPGNSAPVTLAAAEIAVSPQTKSTGELAQTLQVVPTDTSIPTRQVAIDTSAQSEQEPAVVSELSSATMSEPAQPVRVLEPSPTARTSASSLTATAPESSAGVSTPDVSQRARLAGTPRHTLGLDRQPLESSERDGDQATTTPSSGASSTPDTSVPHGGSSAAGSSSAGRDAGSGATGDSE